MNPDKTAEDEDSLGQLHRELAPQLVRLAWVRLRDWSAAADAMQEAFLLLAAKRSEVPEEQVRGWLVKTVQYCALNLCRSRERRERLHTSVTTLRESAGEYVTGGESCEVERQEQLERLREALQRLPDEQQQVIGLRLRDERSFAEIAQELNLPLGTVLSRMRLGLEKLRRELNS